MMASLRRGYDVWKGPFRSSRPYLLRHFEHHLEALYLGSSTASRRHASTDSIPTDTETSIQVSYESLIKQASQLPQHARAVPASPSYFSRQQRFNDKYLSLQALDRKYGRLPKTPADQVKRIAWKSLADYKQTVGEAVKAPDYKKAMEIVKRLHNVHPDLKPAAVDEELDIFKRDIQAFENVPRPVTIDKFGRSIGTGKRKSSIARAWVVEGTGEVQVNGKTLAEAFGRVHDRESATWALRATNRMDKYNVWALVEGGGTTGQAEALTLAVAKALLVHEPALKPALRRAGCITRDVRTVERKKHGHVKARKMPTWVKR